MNEILTYGLVIQDFILTLNIWSLNSRLLQGILAAHVSIGRFM
ncbi:hypothetical protein [Psychrobacter sp. TWP2-1-2]